MRSTKSISVEVSLIRTVSFKWCVVAVMCLGACSERHPAEPLVPSRMDAQQAEGLRRMNEAGTTAFAGRTWNYEFGAGCVLRVRQASDGHPEPLRDYVMTGRNVDVVPYASGGFGVKAYDGRKGSSVDLFDASSNAEAISFARYARRLIAPCAVP
jgi:hypothetical protein